jgi:hypothetical protein
MKCSDAGECFDPGNCTDDFCTGKECGTDKCGASCGSCPVGKVCGADFKCSAGSILPETDATGGKDATTGKDTAGKVNCPAGMVPYYGVCKKISTSQTGGSGGGGGCSAGTVPGGAAGALWTTLAAIGLGISVRFGRKR